MLFDTGIFFLPFLQQLPHCTPKNSSILHIVVATIVREIVRHFVISELGTVPGILLFI